MKSFILAILFSLSFPYFVGVENANAVTSYEKISARLNDYVAEALSLKPSEIEIATLKPANGAMQFFPGKVTHIRPAKLEKLLGRVLFALTTQPPQGRIFVQWVLADIARLQKVVVVTHPLKRHHVIEKGDLSIQTIRVKNRETPYASDPGRLVGKRMKRALRMGQAIRTDRIEENPIILRGDRIVLSLKIGGLSIATTGLAKEDGLLGALIKVVNLDSRKTVMAKVIGPAQVRVASMGGE